MALLKTPEQIVINKFVNHTKSEKQRILIF